MRLLIVDNEETFSGALARLIRRRLPGVEVATSPSAADALAEATVTRYDVVLTDVDMAPGESGFWLADRMRERGIRSSLAIMSADTVSGNRGARARALGARLIEKTRPEEIIAEVLSLAEAREGRVAW